MSPIGNPLGREMHWPKRKRGPRGPRCRIQSSQKQGSARPARTGAGTATAAGSATALSAGTGAEHRLRLHRQQAFALQLLAGELARAAHGFGLFTGLLFGGLFIVTAELHLAENALALHLLLQRLEGLIDIVIANENLHAASSFNEWFGIYKKERGDRRAEPLTLSARMYQTKPAMSTGAKAIEPPGAAKSGFLVPIRRFLARSRRPASHAPSCGPAAADPCRRGGR